MGESERLDAGQKEKELLKELKEERQAYELHMEEKYFEGRMKRDKMRTSTIVGTPLFDAESILLSSEGGPISDPTSKSVRQRKKKLKESIMRRNSMNSLAGGSTMD